MLSGPAYTFTLPSIGDDTTLECRLYHPDVLPSDQAQWIKVAVFAHPYAPLGGSFDDAAVLAVIKTLLEQDYSVATFNFRGAGNSGGKTSWTGHDEQNDFETVIGFLIYYIHVLYSGFPKIELLLGGYSYGSLVLNRLPNPSSIVQRFQECEIGTSGSEILLRARKLAEQSRLTAVHEASTTPRGRTLTLGQAIRSARPSPVTMGGEETDSTERRRSHDARRSGEIVRKSLDVSHRIAHHLHHVGKRSSRDDLTHVNTEKNTPSRPPTVGEKFEPNIFPRYLLISPVLMPFTATLLPPGPPLSVFAHSSAHHDTKAESQFLVQPTLAIFGSADSFTSSKRLSTWATRQAKESQSSNFTWKQIEGANHFWHDQPAKSQLQDHLKSWLVETSFSSPSAASSSIPLQDTNPVNALP